MPNESAPRAELHTCPRCGGRVVEIVYGEPEPTLSGVASRGRVILGGCLVGRPGGDPDRGCTQCGAEFIRGKMVEGDE